MTENHEKPTEPHPPTANLKDLREILGDESSGGMNLDRYEEILDAQATGIEIEISPEEEKEVKERKEQFHQLAQRFQDIVIPTRIADLAKGVQRQQTIVDSITSQIDTSTLGVAALGNSAALKASRALKALKPANNQSPYGLDSQYLEFLNEIADTERANQKEQRELQRRQTELLQQLAESMVAEAESTKALAAAFAAQETTSSAMAKHQRAMNWLILGATLAGVAAAVLFGLFGD